jgi:regulator of extracellular matrix RemA (YlzA/DUF370 family)
MNEGNVKFISVGFENLLAASRIIAIINPDSAPARRLVKDARAAKNLIDATSGRKCRSVIIMDDSRAVLSAIQPETIAARASGAKTCRGAGLEDADDD